MGAPAPVVWAFWSDPNCRARFGRDGLFLAKWLTLAFVLESLMVAYVDWVVSAVGGEGAGSIAIATLAGIPAYLNGYAALPLLSG